MFSFHFLDYSSSFLLSEGDLLQIEAILIANEVGYSYPEVAIIGMLDDFWVIFGLNVLFASNLLGPQLFLRVELSKQISLSACDGSINILLDVIQSLKLLFEFMVPHRLPSLLRKKDY